MSELNFDENTPIIEEKVVLAKYDGQYTQEEIDELHPEPVETITVVNGEVVDHWVKEDN